MAWETLYKTKRLLGEADIASGGIYDIKAHTNGVELKDPQVFVSFSNYDFSSGYTNIYSSYLMDLDQKITVHCDISKTVLTNFTASGLTYTFNNIFYYEARVEFVGFSDNANVSIGVRMLENGVYVGDMAQTKFWQVPVSGVGIRTEAEFLIRRNFSTPQSFTISMQMVQNGFWDAGLTNLRGGYSTGQKIDRGGRCNLIAFNGENS